MPKVTFDDFKSKLYEEHRQRDEFLTARMGDKSDFQQRLRAKKEQVFALQDLAETRQHSYTEMHKIDSATRAGREMYHDALNKRNRAMMNPRDLVNRDKDKEAHKKAKNDKKKWDQLLALDDKTSTEEERQLVEQAERLANGLPALDITPAVPPPLTAEEKWTLILEMEDAALKIPSQRPQNPDIISPTLGDELIELVAEPAQVMEAKMDVEKGAVDSVWSSEDNSAATVEQQPLRLEEEQGRAERLVHEEEWEDDPDRRSGQD
mmetsp:Transcript_15151/g.29090  ORF Transcript_15151/g.29090 Transcript_15151/m.29090 type:complete len:264 (+) Transcript_15151:426-1217(+)